MSAAPDTPAASDSRGSSEPSLAIDLKGVAFPTPVLAASGCFNSGKEMAELLIKTLSGPFEPERYRDQYRERLRVLLEERASPLRTAAPELEAATSPTGIEDLMAALQASVERARQQKAEKDAPTPRTARRGRRGA